MVYGSPMHFAFDNCTVLRTIAPMPEETARLPSPPDSPPPLIFHWKRLRGVKRRLAAFLIVAAAGHAALFYLVRVVPSISSQKPPRQQAVVYLPASVPGIRGMLSALNDRYPGAVVESEDYSRQADMAELAAAVPRLSPVRGGRRAVLKEFTQPLAPQEMPRLMQPGDPFLPEVAPPAALSPVRASAEPFQLSIVPADLSRALLVSAMWPEAFSDDSATRSLTFMLALNRHGRPQHCMALSAGSNETLEVLRRGLMTTRWEARPAITVEWITVHVRW